VPRTTDFTDSQLLEMIRDGDVAAFKLLYLRYFSALCKSGFRKIQDDKVVEEIVQDIFVDLWRKRHELDAGKEIGAFLNALLRNKILHEWRAQQIRQRHVEVFSQLNTAVVDESFSEQFYANEIQERLNAAICNLSPQCRQAFELSRYEHLSYREISERMSISVKTVEKHIGKALKILKLELKEYHITLAMLISIWLQM
jgi:RNA polymerase sigma-70 factor (ECF subfamily)